MSSTKAFSLVSMSPRFFLNLSDSNVEFYILLECGLRSFHCDFVISSITVLKSKVKVFDVQVQEREDQLHAINIRNNQCKGKWGRGSLLLFSKTNSARSKSEGNEYGVRCVSITLSLIDFQNTLVISSPAHQVQQIKNVSAMFPKAD